MILKPTAEEVAAHMAICIDGPECKLRKAQEWAEQVARPGHVTEVRDVMMSLHLAEIHGQDMTDSANTLTTLLGAVVRRAPGKTIDVPEGELIDGDRLVLEETDTGIDVSIVSLGNDLAQAS